MFHIRAEASEHALVLIARHRLFDDCLWRAPASIAADAAAQARFELADAVEGWDAGALKKTLRLRRDGLHLARAAELDEPRCSVRDVLSAEGKQLESGDVAELAAAEASLISAIKAFEHKLEKLAEFDSRREWGHDAEDVDANTTADGWMRRVL